jgi:hypothetical protein
MLNILIFKQCIVLAEALALVTGIITWKKWAHTHYKWVAPYLFFIVTAECTGYYLDYTKQLETLNVMYNAIVIPTEISFVCWLFYKSPPETFKKLIAVLWSCYLMSLLLESLYFNSADYIFRSFSYTTGNVIMLILVLRYFTWLTRSENILSFKSSIMFWLSAGILVFYGGTLVYYGLYNVMAKKDIAMFISYTWIMIGLNYAMYILFTIGLIWSKAN